MTTTASEERKMQTFSLRTASEKRRMQKYSLFSSSGSPNAFRKMMKKADRLPEEPGRRS